MVMSGLGAGSKRVGASGIDGCGLLSVSVRLELSFSLQWRRSNIYRKQQRMYWKT